MSSFLWPHTHGQVRIDTLQERRSTRPEDPVELEFLMASITKSDVVVPVIVNSTYEVIDGMRRVAAAQKLGHTTIPCVATSSYRTIIAHMGDTFRLTKEWGLPRLPPLPRAICDIITLLAEVHATDVIRTERKRPLQTRRTSVLATHQRQQFHDDMAALWGWQQAALRCVRTVYSLDRTLDTRSPQVASAVRGFIAEWEATWPHGLAPCSAKTRVYTLIRQIETGVAPTVHASRPKRVVPPPAPTVFTSNMTKNQRAAFNDSLTVLTGAVSGLVGIRELSPKLGTAELVDWERQLTQLTSSLRAVRSTIRGNIRTRDAFQEESTP